MALKRIMYCATQHGKSDTFHRQIQKAHLTSTINQIRPVIQLRKEESERLTTLAPTEGNRTCQLLTDQSEHPIPQDAVSCEKGRQSFGSDPTRNIPIPTPTSPPMRKGQLRVTLSDTEEKHNQSQIRKSRRRWPQFLSCSRSAKAAEDKIMRYHVNSIPDIQVWDIDDSDTFTQVMMHFTLK
jgi:hypothetical protein